MPKFITAKDTNYVKGMNSLDDPKILSDGEAVEIVNAIPGIPLKMRNGCEGYLAYWDYHNNLAILDSYIASKPFYVRYDTVNGYEEYLLFVLINTFYCSLCYKRLGAKGAKDDIAYNVTSHFSFYDVAGRFDFIRIGDIVYLRGGGTNNFWALEYTGNQFVAFKVRTIPTSDFDPQITFGVAVSGGTAFQGGAAVGYSLTFVRRVDDSSNSVITTYAPGLIESPEVPSSRVGVVYFSTYKFGFFINPSSLGVGVDNVYGFTHIRVYRTDNLYATLPNPSANADDADNKAHIAGATRYFLMDIPISHFYDSNGYLVNYVVDNISPDALSGEMNQLQSFNYTFPPTDGYRMLYFKNRLFLMGKRGMVYFSEIPGGDGGGDLEFATEESAKYALWFKPLHWRLELNPEENTASTGLDYYSDDLYMFKENKVYMIIGGDPLASPLRMVNDKTGCPFPDTITRAIIDGREVLFYLSNAGPMLISTGGNNRPFLEFKVKELWPDTGSDLFRFSLPNKVASFLTWCSAAYWDNTLWIFYNIPAGQNENSTHLSRIFGFTSTDEINGAFEVRLAEGLEENRYDIRNIVITNDNRAITIGNVYLANSLYLALVNFLSNEESCDTLQKYEDNYAQQVRPNFSLLSRKIYPGPLERSVSELFRVTSYCDFSEDGLDGHPFLLEITSNRLRTFWDYYADRTIFQSNQLGKPVAGSSLNGFTRGDGKTWTAGALVGYAAYLYHKDYPDNGVWANVRGNTETHLEFDTGVGMNFTHVRLIAKPTVRLNIDFAPKADFVGEFFQYRITKAIPKDRNFNWYGLEMQAIPRPQLDVESLVGGEPNRNAWE